MGDAGLLGSVRKWRELGWHVYEFANGLRLWEPDEVGSDAELAYLHNRAMAMFEKADAAERRRERG